MNEPTSTATIKLTVSLTDTAQTALECLRLTMRMADLVPEHNQYDRRRIAAKLRKLTRRIVKRMRVDEDMT